MCINRGVAHFQNYVLRLVGVTHGRNVVHVAEQVAVSDVHQLVELISGVTEDFL